MLKEAIDKIKELTLGGTNLVVREFPDSPGRLIVSQGGAWSWCDLPRPPHPRRYDVFSLESLIDLAAREFRFQPLRLLSLWHDEDAVVLLFGEGERRDAEWARWGLQHSAPSIAIRALRMGKFFSQVELIRFLRFELAGAVPQGLVGVFRSLNMRWADVEQSDVEHQRSTLGKSVDMEVTGASNLPEDFAVSYSIYENFPVAITVQVGVEVDFQKRGFQLRVISSSLSLAEDATRGRLAERIGELLYALPELSGVGVFAGTPSCLDEEED